MVSCIDIFRNNVPIIGLFFGVLVFTCNRIGEKAAYLANITAVFDFKAMPF